MKLDQLSKEEFQKQTEIEKDLINFNVWDIAFKIAYKKYNLRAMQKKFMRFKLVSGAKGRGAANKGNKKRQLLMGLIGAAGISPLKYCT